MDLVKSGHDLKRHKPPQGMQRGYALPDPNVIASVERDTTRGEQITMYLRLRPLLHYRLQSPAFQPLTAPEWRRVLGLELHTSSRDGWAAQIHAQVKADLSRCLTEGNMQVTIQFSHLM